MARSKIPGPLERRHLVEGEQSETKALAIAEAYLEQGREVEAVDFLRIAGADEKLAELQRGAVERGDAFLLRAVAHARRREPDREDWRRLAAAAERSGLESYAAEARRQAERSD